MENTIRRTDSRHTRLLAGLLLLCLLPPAGRELAAQSHTPYPDLEFQAVLLAPEADMPEHLPADENPAPVPDEPRNLEEDIARAEAALEALAANSGAFDQDSLEHAHSLGYLYQEAQRHEEAISTLNQAHQLTRIHQGLYSPDQLALVEALIESHKALEDYERADEMEAALYYVGQKSTAPGSDARAQADLRRADWNVEYFLDHYLYQYKNPTEDRDYQRRSLYGRRSSRMDTLPPTAVTIDGPASPYLESVLTDQTPRRSGRYLSSENERLNMAEDIYETLLENESNPAQQALYEQKLIAIGYYRKLEVEIMLQQLGMDPYDRVTYQDLQHVTRTSYYAGRDLLQERAEASADTPLSPEHLNARLNLADWHLLFDYSSQARNTYEAIYTDLQEAGWETDRIEQLINPEPLLIIPTFIEHQYTPSNFFATGDLTSDTQTNQTSGYVDLELTINRDGSVRSIDTLDYSENSASRLRRLLRDYVEAKRYRPIFVDDESVRQSLQLRYYYHYSEAP